MSDIAKIKKRWPHVDANSIKNPDGTFKSKKEWLDYAGNSFIGDIKDVQKVPQPIHVSKISKATLEEKFPGLDTSKIEGVSANQWVKKDGSKAEIELKSIFIAVRDSETKEIKYYPLKHVTEDILKELYPDLDLASIKTAEGVRLHPSQWKNTNNSKFDFDMDSIFIADWSETNNGIPLITGAKRKEPNGKLKDVCYQKNAPGEPDDLELGTAITQEMVDASRVNTVLDKLGGWLPDLIVTYPRATATIAIIPFVLKTVFGIEKSKKPDPKITVTGKEAA